jgi:hypothetical protein
MIRKGVLVERGWPAASAMGGGGVADIDDEAVFALGMCVLVGGCARWALPPCFGAS